MAAPNIIGLTTATGRTTSLTPSGTSSVVLLPNSSTSNRALKINSLVVANLSTTTAFSCTVSYYTNGGVAQGSAPSGGTAFPIVSTVSIPANASLIVIDKTTQLYLEENRSLVVTSSSANNLVFTVSYEELG